MMEQLKEQTKKAGDKLEGLADKGKEAFDKASKQTQEGFSKVSKQAQESYNKASEQGSKAFDSSKDALHLDIHDDDDDKKKKKKAHRKDSSDSDSDSDEEEGLLHDIGDEFDSLSLKQRLMGAVGCYLLSGLFAFAATVILFTGVRHVRFYTLFYSLSNMVTFASLVFIMGEDRLKKRMLNSKRRVSGRVWMWSLGLSLVMAFFFPSHWFIVLLLLLAQFVAMIWYSASFIPFARKFIKKYATENVIDDLKDGKLDGK